MCVSFSLNLGQRMRIAFLGDSLTWGGYGGNFVDQLAQLLPTHDIMNAGVGGNTVFNLLDRLEDVLEQAPNGIFVMVGGNDAISYSQPDVRPYYRQVQNIPEGCVTPEMFTQTYRELLTRIQLEHILAWVGLEPTEYNPQVVDTLRLYNTRAQEVADALGVPVLDLMKEFIPEQIPERPPLTQAFIQQIGQRERTGWNDYDSAQKEGAFTYTFDGMHLTPASAQRMAKIIAHFLKDDLT